MAALELGLPEALPATLESAAEATGCRVDGLRRLLAALGWLGLVRVESGTWALTDAGQALLGAGTVGRGQLAQFGYNRGAWPQLPSVLRTGVPVEGLTWPEWALGADMADPWGERTRAEAEALAPSLAVPEGGCFYDIGCGDGRVAEAVLRRDPTARVRLFDRALVLRATTARLDELGLSGRFEAHAVDLFAEGLPEGADVALLGNILHSYDDALNRKLVARAARSLRPGGRLVVRDLRVDVDGPRIATDFALHIALLARMGDAHADALVRDWMVAAGLTAIEALPGYPSEHGTFATVGTR